MGTTEPMLRCAICGAVPTKAYGPACDGAALRLQLPLCGHHGDLYLFRAAEILGEMLRERHARRESPS